jgi:hypothetical protein
MPRLLAAAVTSAALLTAVPAAAPAAQPSGGAPTIASKTCSSRFTHAVIGGSEKCLHAGEFCATAYRRQYVGYGYHCVAGRLR